jgi:YVTN family beta-propeller protein
VEICGLCGRFHRISGDLSGGTITILQKDIEPDGIGTALGAVINPVNGRVYLAKQGQSGGAHRVVEFGTGRTVTFSGPPRDVAVTPDGKFLFVANQAVQGFVSVIDTETFSLVGTVNVGRSPGGLAIWQAPP